MNTRWLTADEQELEAAVKKLDKESRPKGKPRNFTVAGTGYLILLVYFGVVWFTFAGRIDAEAEVASGAVGSLILGMVIFVVCWYGGMKLAAWLMKPTRRSQVRAWHEHMTALANDVEPEPLS